MNKKIFKRRNGYSMIELVVVVGIFTFIIAGLFVSLRAGRDAWFTTDSQIRITNNLRTALERMSKELRESSPDNSRLVIVQGVGQNNSDIIIFTIPVVCQAGGIVMNSTSDVSNWGAPLTWGCTSSACMDADNNCATIDYKELRYMLNNNNQLIRLVLNNANMTAGSTVIAEGISDVQASISGNIVTLTITGIDTGGLRRAFTVSRSLDIWLRNRG